MLNVRPYPAAKALIFASMSVTGRAGSVKYAALGMTRDEHEEIHAARARRVGARLDFLREGRRA
jgi:hypothetical protein